LACSPWVAAFALSISACSDAELSHDGFGFQVEFSCKEDRADSDHLQLIIQQDDCDGPTVYDETIARGEAPKSSEALAPGSYGFRALALRRGALLAEAACVVSTLPDGDKVVLKLASEACREADHEDEVPPDPVDAGAEPEPDAAAERDAEPDQGTEPDPADSAAAAPQDGGQQTGATQDPVVVVPPPPACKGAACACSPGCSADQTCQNGSCRPNQSLSSRCTAQRFQDHDYLFCGDSLGWNAARRKCRSFGMGLVSIESESENDFVQIHAGGVDRWIGANDLGQSDFNLFAGLSADLSIGLRLGVDASCKRIQGELGEGNWYWSSKTTDTSNGTPLCAFANASAKACAPPSGQYQHWRANEPSNAGCLCAGICTPGEDCGMMHATDGSWDDQSCSFGVAAFVCESP
jgi:hypothetical protein